MKWTENDIKNSAVAKLNQHLNLSNSTPLKPSNSVVLKKLSPQKDWLDLNLQYWANEKGVELVPEYKFHKKRKWRFDWAFPSIKVAVEYEGLFSKKSRHTTIKGYQGDIEKYNAATIEGWKVIRVTAKDYKKVIGQLNELL